VDREHAPLYGQRRQVWQARSVRGEVWQMSARRDPDRSALAVFADELRAQRERAGLGRDDLAGRVNYSASLISMIESGHRSPSRDFAARCDEAFGTPGTFARLERRLRDVPFSSGFRPFQPYESQAATLRLFEHSLVPGLLQTEAYARAVLETHPNTPAEVVEERVAARLARQVILDRDDPPPPLLWVLLDEHVLTREIGGPKVMHDQLVRLAELARWPNITVQVIPGLGAHPGLLGAFAVAEMTGMPAIVYLETAHDGQTLEDPDAVAAMSVRFDALRTEALTGRASLSLIEKVTEERWTT
jgi:transcriptional regulator with XRE-family HTH domain